MSCNGNDANAYNSIFETEFNITHHKARAVADNTSLILYKKDKSENEQEVACWEHGKTYESENVLCCTSYTLLAQFHGVLFKPQHQGLHEIYT